MNVLELAALCNGQTHSLFVDGLDFVETIHNRRQIQYVFSFPQAHWMLAVNEPSARMCQGNDSDIQ